MTQTIEAQQLATLAGVHPATICRRQQAGTLPPLDIDAIAEWVASQTLGLSDAECRLRAAMYCTSYPARRHA